MTHKEYDIFISYRRVGGADKARILKTELEARGYKVFLDFDELKDGVFDKRIMDAIDSSPIFMFLLTPNSLERCLNDDDWVRKEIEYAVDNHKHFIPINPDCTFTSLPAGLSAKVMAGLGQHQFSDVMFGQLFKASINELVADRIRPVLAEWGRVAAASAKGAIVRIETDLDCRILRFGKEIGMAQSDDIAEIKLPKGKHKLQFVGLENSADSYECLLSVEDLEYEDYIEVKLLEKYNARKSKEEVEHKAEERAERRIEQNKRLIWSTSRNVVEQQPKKIRLIQVAKEFKVGMSTLIDFLYEKDVGVNWTPNSMVSSDIYSMLEMEFGLKRRVAGYHDILNKKQIGYLLSLSDDEFVGLKYDKYGYIDKTGKEVIDLKYDGAGYFDGGKAYVELNGEEFYIDKNGNRVEE